MRLLFLLMWAESDATVNLTNATFYPSVMQQNAEELRKSLLYGVTAATVGGCRDFLYNADGAK